MSLPTPPGASRRADPAALVIAALLLVLAAVIAWNASGMRAGTGYSGVGPASFPFLVAAGLAILAVATAAAAWRGQFPARGADAPAPILWIVGGLLAQLLLLKTAGFSIATGVLFAATARGFGRGPLWLTVPIGVVFAFCVWIIFSQALKLALPAGPLEQLFF